MDKELKEMLEKTDRYSGFMLLDEPTPFNIMFKDKDVDLVQLHSTQTITLPSGNKDIVGFCGVCSWKDNVLTPRDGDSYSKTMTVYGYEWFESDDGTQGLDILVGEDW